jgi:hypothetical protein
VTFRAYSGDKFGGAYSASCGFDGLGDSPYQCSASVAPNIYNGRIFDGSFHVWKSTTLTDHPGPRTSHPHKGHRHLPPGRHNQHRPSHRTED